MHRTPSTEEKTTTPTMNSDGAPRGWSSPTHPPYANMIASAIRFMAEEAGSTEEGISEYFRTHYDGLPWADDHFPPYHLSQLTDLGHSVAGAPGRYLTAYRDDAPASSVAAPGPYPAKSNPALEGAPPAASPNFSHASETGSTMSITEHGGFSGQQAKHSLPTFGFSGSQPDDGIQQDASSVRKRRGRPPKRVADAAPEPAQVQAREDVRPRRGRPPKEKVTKLNATGEHGEHGKDRPLPVPDNGASSSHICMPLLPPPTFDMVDGLDYVLALPNQGLAKCAAAVKEDPQSVEGLKAASNAEGTSVSSNGEAKNEAVQPARPSMATSHHPLCAMMIPAAIQNLPEDGRSTEAAKSGCMIANYDRPVPFYLDVDLANTEEFVGTTPSLYMPVYDDSRLTPPGSMVGGEPGWCMANNGQWLHAAAAGPSTAELNPGGAPGTSKPSPDSETGSTMSLVEPVVNAFVQQPQLFAFPEPAANGVKQQHSGEDPHPVRKRRGRPPKRKIDDTDLARDGRENTNNAPQAAPGNGGSDPLVRRRRGRPRKRPLNEGDRNSGDAQHVSGWSMQTQTQAPALADSECYAPMRSSEPAESPTPAEAPPSEDWIADDAFLLALLEGTDLEFDASVRKRLEFALKTPFVEAARSGGGETPPPAWGSNALMAASGSFGTVAIGWGVAGDNAAVPERRGRGRPPKGQGRRGRPRKNQ